MPSPAVNNLLIAVVALLCVLPVVWEIQFLRQNLTTAMRRKSSPTQAKQRRKCVCEERAYP